MVGSPEMVTSRSDFASQLRREPGRVINPTKVNFVRIILPLNLLDNFPTSKGYVSKANAIAEKSIRTSLVINHYEVPHVFPL